MTFCKEYLYALPLMDLIVLLLFQMPFLETREELSVLLCRTSNTLQLLNADQCILQNIKDKVTYPHVLRENMLKWTPASSMPGNVNWLGTDTLLGGGGGGHLDSAGVELLQEVSAQEWYKSVGWSSTWKNHSIRNSWMASQWYQLSFGIQNCWGLRLMYSKHCCDGYS